MNMSLFRGNKGERSAVYLVNKLDGIQEGVYHLKVNNSKKFTSYFYFECILFCLCVGLSVSVALHSISL